MNDLAAISTAASQLRRRAQKLPDADGEAQGERDAGKRNEKTVSVLLWALPTCG